MFVVSRTFASRLQDLLHAKGWSAYKLSEEAKIPRSNVSAYLSGKAFPEDKTLERIVAQLDVELDELRTLVKLSQIGPDWEEKVERYGYAKAAEPTANDVSLSSQGAELVDDTPKPGTIAFAQAKAKRIQQEREAERLRREEELERRIDERLAVPDVAATTDDDVHTFEPDHRDAVEGDGDFPEDP